jgi:hypothetical protein
MTNDHQLRNLPKPPVRILSLDDFVWACAFPADERLKRGHSGLSAMVSYLTMLVAHSRSGRTCSA